MAPAPASDNTLVSLTLELQVKPALLHWLDDRQRQFGMRNRDALVSRLLETLSRDGERA